MGIAEIIALCSGGILIGFGIIFMVSYMMKYVKLYGLINLIINIGWVIVGLSALALYISMWFINLRLIAGITIIVFIIFLVGIGLYQSDN